MGIFSRFRDIVSANLNAILDKAEDPEKMVRLMIQEMEDTLIEVKSNCAGILAEQKKLTRELQSAEGGLAQWGSKAELAVGKGRDDLAKAALNEKRRFQKRTDWLHEELERTKQTIAGFHEDIALLEAKLCDAREKQRSIIQRRAAAQARFKTHSHIRKVDTSDAFMKFEAYENSIERLEAEADLVDRHRPKRPTLHDEIAELENEEEIEQELQDLKKKVQPEK